MAPDYNDTCPRETEGTWVVIDDNTQSTFKDYEEDYERVPEGRGRWVPKIKVMKPRVHIRPRFETRPVNHL